MWSDDNAGSDGDEYYDDYDANEEDGVVAGDRAVRMELGDFVADTRSSGGVRDEQSGYDDLEAEEDRQLQLAMAASMQQFSAPPSKVSTLTALHGAVSRSVPA